MIWTRKGVGLVILVILPVLAVVVMLVLGRRDDKDAVGSSLVARAAPQDIEGFTRADGSLRLSFPQDHGPHPEYQTEWWYYTGNLATADGRRFGYQLTFFRRALLPPERLPERASDWAGGQVYMAHFALTDVEGGQHQAFERLSRGAAGLAGAQGDPFQVWLEDWRVEQIETGPAACTDACSYRLFAAQEDIRLELNLHDLKGPILQGDQGYSSKGAEPGQASYYYSLTRLESSGMVEVDGRPYAVDGLSWMDHEFSTSALSKEQIGWDWFSLQLEDGSELMAFQIRRADGSIDPFSSGTFIHPDGSTTHLSRGDFSLLVGNTWQSARSGATYPASWTLIIPSLDLTLEIEPLLADQELNVSYAYWEGAVAVAGRRGESTVAGYGFVELTGYSGSMGGEF